MKKYICIKRSDSPNKSWFLEKDILNTPFIKSLLTKEREKVLEKIDEHILGLEGGDSYENGYLKGIKEIKSLIENL